MVYITTGKNIALTIWTFVGKMMFLLFNTLSGFVIAFLPRSKRLLISWLQLPSAMTLEPKKIKSVTEPMDCSSPGSSVYIILQARILEWVAIHFSGGREDLPNLGIEPQASHTAG